jgi:hypothetical protein
MKALEIIMFRSLQVLGVALFSTTLIALSYAIVQLCLGNYSGTACREF